MWIDTSQYITCKKSANRAVKLPDYHASSPYIHAPQSRPTNNWSRSASPFKTPPRSQVYTFSTPRSSARPSSLSRDF
ncbi:hypothetical protein BASA50_009930 [Batrachochytrium salamandrivorans]|uniref:Uncharacterized protein n=1 Tax=Batrachochytrium salamandrivorans TaxID=1357716 RepID=A0ABQ8F000_9FUNG|nr:hypothetical protein BASA50_009930 [Batrachochytrium salamandrivorans]